jgi:hypothetical protein
MQTKAKESQLDFSCNTALIGAFMMEGLKDAGNPYCEILEAYNNGCVGLIEELTQYAPYMQELYDKKFNENDDCCNGVYVYDVVNPFGTWFGQYILNPGKKYGNSPSKEECLDWINVETEKFFNQ